MSQLVPPTSREMAFSRPISRHSRWVPTTPATGPDMSVCTGARAITPGVATPPLDCMISTRAPSSNSLMAASMVPT